MSMTDKADIRGDDPGRDRPAAQRLFLVAERAGGGSPLKALELDRTPRYLRVDADGVPELLAPAVRSDPDLALQVVDAGARPAVLVQQSPACAGAPRVNGTPMPPLGFRAPAA